MTSCQASTGNWLVMRIEPLPYLSSTISIRSRRCGAVSRSGPQSSRSEPSRRHAFETDGEQIGADELPEQAREAAVAMGELEIGEEARQAVVEDACAIAAGLLAKRAGKPGLAHAARPGDEQVLALPDPFARGQLAEQIPVEPARGAVVDILDRRADMAQLRRPHSALVALGAAVRCLAVDQQADPLGMAERGGVGLLL